MRRFRVGPRIGCTIDACPAHRDDAPKPGGIICVACRRTTRSDAAWRKCRKLDLHRDRPVYGRGHVVRRPDRRHTGFIRQDMVWPWILLLVLLACSAVFSSSETALFSLSRHDLYELRTGGGRLGRLVARLMRHPRRVLLTILVANTAVNVCIFADSLFLARQWEHAPPGTSAAVGVAVLLAVVVLGETVPKVIALAGARRWAPLIAPVIEVTELVVAPVRWVLTVLVVEPILRLLIPPGQRAPYLTIDELKLLVANSRRAGHIGAVEDLMLQHVVELTEVKVREVMVPRVDVVAYPLDGDPEELRELFRRTCLSKIPVYEGDIDRIRGLVYAKEVFLQKDRPIAALVRPVRYVPEQSSLAHLLRHFRQTRSQIAMVVDEHGGIAGLVTLEDVLEHIVGELSDEHDAEPEPEFVQIDERTLEVAGDLRIRDWAEAFGVPIGGLHVTTIAGLVLSRLQRVPRIGDRVRVGNVEIIVVGMRGRRITRLQVRALGPADKVPTPSEGTTRPSGEMI